VNRKHSELQPVGYAHFVEYLVEVMLDRLLTDEEVLRDLPVRASVIAWTT
jgi:hypothetical protein